MSDVRQAAEKSIKKGTQACYVVCAHCHGTGTVELTGVYAETLALIIRRPGLNGAQLAAIAGCNGTAMNMRVKALERLGVVIGKRYGREITWTHQTT